jgi:hypothetical protein
MHDQLLGDLLAAAFVQVEALDDASTFSRQP